MYQSEFCDINYNEELNIVFVKWKKFCRQDDYRKPLLFAIDIMRQHDGCHYVFCQEINVVNLRPAERIPLLRRGADAGGGVVTC